MKKVAIIVGHEKARAGAKGLPPLEAEYFYNLDIAAVLFERLKERGLEPAVFLKDGKSSGEVGAEVGRFAAGCRACCLELHYNAGGGEGTETLYDKAPPTSKLFASIIQRQLVAALGTRNRGAKLIGPGDRGHYNLSAVTIPSCLVEPAFGDSPTDAAILIHKSDKYIDALADACVEFLGDNP